MTARTPSQSLRRLSCRSTCFPCAFHSRIRARKACSPIKVKIHWLLQGHFRNSAVSLFGKPRGPLRIVVPQLFSRHAAAMSRRRLKCSDLQATQLDQSTPVRTRPLARMRGSCIRYRRYSTITARGRSECAAAIPISLSTSRGSSRPAISGSAALTAACRPTRSSACCPANSLYTATSPTWWCTATSIAFP